MRVWLAVVLASCGGARSEPPSTSPPPPPHVLPASASVAPPAPPPRAPAAPPPPTTLGSTPGFERPTTPIAFTPAKGTVAASCRVPESGELALALNPETVPRALASCKAPAGARFVVRVEAAPRAPKAGGVLLQDGASAKDAACVGAALLKSGFFFETGPDDAPRVYDCYVAFY